MTVYRTEFVSECGKICGRMDLRSMYENLEHSSGYLMYVSFTMEGETRATKGR